MVTVNIADIYGIAGNASTGAQFASYAAPIISASDWASYKLLYDECRIIAFDLDFAPGRTDQSIAHCVGIANSTSTGTNPGPFTSLTQMVQYNYRTIYTYKPFKLSWKMSTTEEAQWAPTANTPANHGYLTAFFPGATTTGGNLYGFQITTWLVQFRGRS